MARSLLRGEQIIDEDVLSELEHDQEPHYFDDLVDVTTYSGNPGKCVVVNASGTGLDYAQNTLSGPWVVKTSAYTASDDDRIIVDTTSSGAYTITLPSVPVYGDSVCIFDGGGNCGTVNVTIGRNEENIHGIAQDLIVDSDDASFELVFYNTSRGWIIYE